MALFRNTGIVEKIARVKIFLGTGQGYVQDFKYPVLFAIALKVYLPQADNLTLGLIALVAMICMAIVGWFDLKFIKLPQTTAEINTREYNPYFNELEKTLKRETK